MPTELPGGLVTLLGLFAPIVIQMVTRYIPNELGRFFAALALSGLTAAAAMWYSKIPWTLTVQFISVWFTFATIAFKLFWKPMFQKTGVLQAPATKY